MFYFASQQRIVNITENLHISCSRISYYADIYLLWASEAQGRPGLLSSNPTGVGIPYTANGARMRVEFFYPFDYMHNGLSDIS